ncbi:MAG TPA: DUF3566 domain-containing protein [Acidimicrobiales bacterium]|nr:DUF3566 domain-containing protein [Acidimicrobiales bacterium]
MSTDPTGVRPSPDATGPQPTVPDERRGTQAPAPSRSRRGRGRKVRKVHRVVRHLDIWSVAKLAAVFALCWYVVGMISGYLLWQAADRVGTIDGIEGFFEDAGGYDTFEILGDIVFRAAAVVGLLLAALGVFAAVLGALLFNLISDLTGGVRMTVIDEDLIVAPARRRTVAPGGPPQTPNGQDSQSRPDRTAERPATSSVER